MEFMMKMLIRGMYSHTGMNMLATKIGRKDVVDYLRKLDGLTIFVIPMKKQWHI